MQLNTKKLLLTTLMLSGGIFVWQNSASAGFGISPPYVRTNKIIPGSHYEQVVTLLRSSAEDDLQADVQVVAPDIASWISIDKGETFDLPKGKLQVPMIVKVDVPPDTEIGNYKGYLNIRVAPKGAQAQGGVAIALGARVDIDLTVTNEAFYDFLVRAVSIPDLEEPGWPWNWPIFSRFFYRVNMVMKVENTGNAKVAPTKVHIDIYDIGEKKLLESHDDKSVKKIEPYQTTDITASFPTELTPGEYWGKIKIYKDTEVVRTDQVAFTIYKPGAGPAGIVKIGKWQWILLFGYIFIILAFIFTLIKIKIWRYIFKLLYLLSWPIRFLAKKSIELWQKTKLKFWRWLHKKSAKYQDLGFFENTNIDSRRNDRADAPGTGSNRNQTDSGGKDDDNQT